MQFQIPETPQWLLSKNRAADAEKSLRWLRGWVLAETVVQEFNEMQRHIQRSKSCNACIKQDLQCSHPHPTLREKLAELIRKRTLKPFAIILSLAFLAQFSGVLATRPYLIQIFKAYQIPISTDDAVVVTSIVDNLATMTFMSLIRFTGKRRLYLIMLMGNFLTSFVISYYGFICLPRGYTSFEPSIQFPHSEYQHLTYIPMVALFIWSFFAHCGVIAVPFMYISEIYSFKWVFLVSVFLLKRFSCDFPQMFNILNELLLNFWIISFVICFPDRVEWQSAYQPLVIIFLVLRLKNCTTIWKPRYHCLAYPCFTVACVALDWFGCHWFCPKRKIERLKISKSIFRTTPRISWIEKLPNPPKKSMEPLRMFDFQIKLPIRFQEKTSKQRHAQMPIINYEQRVLIMKLLKLSLKCDWLQ